MISPDINASVPLLNLRGDTVTRYVTQPAAHTPLPLAVAGYFHPLQTPAGVVVTDLAPPDHRHHRGVFLAWVCMRTPTTAADFWGWGELAPVAGRSIVNHSVTAERASLQAVNHWLVDDQPLLRERLTARLNCSAAANHLDLRYELSCEQIVTIPKLAFSGFCARATRKGRVSAMHCPGGTVAHPPPHHLRPESDWPAELWYAMELDLDGQPVTLAVIDHRGNPRSRWHNHGGDIRMINPCITTDAPLTIHPSSPLQLHYSVIACDGPPPAALLDSLSRD